MKKILVLFFLSCVLCVGTFAADVWKYKPLEVTKPSLTSIRVRFTILLNGADYAYDDITVSPSELDGMTLNQKKVYLNTKVLDKCALYIQTYNMANGLNQIVNVEIDIP